MVLDLIYFDNPFAKAMRQFGAKEFAKLIYSAKKIYDENRADLEKDRMMRNLWQCMSNTRL